MRVYHSVDEVPEIKNPVITLGTFDGVHLGHQKIISFLKESAERVDGETVLFTFHPHPRMVLYPDDHNLELIQNIKRRTQRLEEEGIDHLILHPFTKEFARQSATEFVRNILVNKLNVKVLTIGYNHHFGKNREGNIDLLKELAPIYNFEVQEIPALRHGELSISSTKIRRAIKDGDITKANAFLGAPFNFSGTVVKGDKIGTQLGYPTANIGEIEKTQVIPKIGVYAVRVRVEGRLHSGMMNIGYRPTVTDSSEKRIEVHLFDFDNSIYGTEIEIYVIAKTRDEKSFSSVDELKEQLAIDEINCKRILDQSPARV
ncbi:MAG: bifunctional riboflavin kinase/FAD synthetase [Crocinitomicaceae bacterium]|nr:bifunctional riboflavin kinase/FAD synthetase [Crocinitomicaceae bacterium]